MHGSMLLILTHKLAVRQSLLVVATCDSPRLLRETQLGERVLRLAILVKDHAAAKRRRS